MATTRLNEKKEVYDSNTQTIQALLKPEKPDFLNVTLDTDTLDGIEMMSDYRNDTAHVIEKDVLLLKSMFKDLALLVGEQESNIRNVDTSLNNTHQHTEEATKILAEAENKKCIVL